MKQPVFEGLATALVTPFQNDTVDYETLERLLDLQLNAGVDAIVVCGTSGEAATMRDAEQASVIAHCVSYINGRCKVIAGTGSNDTMHAEDKTQAADALGADAVLVVTPYYNKCTQSGLVAHYERIADCVSIPVMAYNVPSRTGVNILPETYRELARHPNICGVKEADSQIAKLAKIRHICGEDFYVWSGNDDSAVAAMAMGAKGLISVVSNILPKKTAKMIRFCLQEHYEEAFKLQSSLSPLIELLFAEPNPIPVKKALQLMGYDVGIPRMPLCEASTGLSIKLQNLLKEQPSV